MASRELVVIDEVPKTSVGKVDKKRLRSLYMDGALESREADLQGRYQNREVMMRGTVFAAPHEVRVDNVPNASIQAPTDAIVRVTKAAICGSDLHIYNLGDTLACHAAQLFAPGSVVLVGHHDDRLELGAGSAPRTPSTPRRRTRPR